MKLPLAAMLVSSSVASFAQSASVGTVEEIKGVVSVSTNGVVTKAIAGTSLSNGSVVFNSGNASSLVRLNNGCAVGLKANQVLTVNAKEACNVLLASVKTVGAPVVMADTDNRDYTPALIVGGIVAGGIIYNVTKNKASGS